MLSYHIRDHAEYLRSWISVMRPRDVWRLQHMGFISRCWQDRPWMVLPTLTPSAGKHNRDINWCKWFAPSAQPVSARRINHHNSIEVTSSKLRAPENHIVIKVITCNQVLRKCEEVIGGHCNQGSKLWGSKGGLRGSPSVLTKPWNPVETAARWCGSVLSARRFHRPNPICKCLRQNKTRSKTRRKMCKTNKLWNKKEWLQRALQRALQMS